MSTRTRLPLLETGIPGLDQVLGGGLPEYSLNLIAGVPGAGKTTFAHQLAFAIASADRPALYFTVLGEPPLKMLRHQRQLAFFDPDKVGTSVRFIDLSLDVLEGDLTRVLDRIVRDLEELDPALVVVDSVRTFVRAKANEDPLQLQGFLQRLAVHLASWEATSILVSEHTEHELADSPVFTMADGALWLSQNKERSSIVRRLEVMKMRGVEAVPGVHTFRMSERGIQVFPRTESALVRRQSKPRARISTGVPTLDPLLGGGLPAGDATLIAGPSGTGKTVLSTHFIEEGARRGERGVLAIFEEHPDDYLERAAGMGHDLRQLIETGALRVIYLRPLDLSAEEILHQVREAVTELGATRLVIDSLNGLELAIASNFRDEFRESLYRLVGALTASGVSILLTVEVMEMFDQLRFSAHTVSFLAQNIVFLRYVELDAKLSKVLVIVKMRRSDHSRALHGYEITDRGIEVGPPLAEYGGILTGVPVPRSDRGSGGS